MKLFVFNFIYRMVPDISLSDMKPALFFVLLIAWNSFAQAQTKHSKSSRFTSYAGLVMAGYQGWFNTASDGAGRGWRHYHGRNGFEPGSITDDLWPDVSEYPDVYPTPFKHADGSVARLPSSYDYSTVELHFKWMKQYGIDGVFVQRFVTDIHDRKGLAGNDRVLEHALKASKTYHRAISVMYDFSGMDQKDADRVINDWKHLVDSFKLTEQGNAQTYLYHRKKPLVGLWGIGFNDGRRYNLDAVAKIMRFFQHDPVYGNCSILLGVPAYWRDYGADTEKDPRLHDIIKKADIIHPWMVGRYDEQSYPRMQSRLKDDIAWCKEHGLDYVPVIYPGFSWHNMHVNKNNPPGQRVPPLDQIPRNRGSFFWKQVVGAVQAGAAMIYIAMFDEIDEGTAIFKIDKDPPVGLSSFVTLEDDIPSDYYLFLSGYAAEILKGKRPLPLSAPQPGNSKRSR